MAGYESITTAPCPRTAVPAAWARAGGDVRAWLPTTGGPVDYADGGIGCREPEDSFADEGAARRCSRAQLVDVPDAARVAREQRAWTLGL
jgi:hypothetical protein